VKDDILDPLNLASRIVWTTLGYSYRCCFCLNHAFYSAFGLSTMLRRKGQVEALGGQHS
jgi:hypothetical protein